jgi:hypothetical protein
MVVQPDQLILDGYVAYAVCNGKIIDSMIMTEMHDRLNGYKGKLVQELIDDGWNFVCDKLDYLDNAICTIQPFPRTVHASPSDTKSNADQLIDMNLTLKMTQTEAERLYQHLSKSLGK